MFKYHASESKNDGVFRYGQLFEFKGNDTIIMRLDLTQKNHKNGVLSFDFSAPRKNWSDNDSAVSNVLYDDIDINKRYRMAVAVFNSSSIQIGLSLT